MTLQSGTYDDQVMDHLPEPVEQPYGWQDDIGEDIQYDPMTDKRW